MATVEMPKSVPCQFNAGGMAPCEKPSDNGLCSEHENLKCCCCGKKALRSCETGMGGLCCGSPLCPNCQHGEDGIHVTAAVYAKQINEREKFEDTGEESPQMLAKRGLPIGLPRNLKEILDGDRKGWTNKLCWALEISHGLMGFFPAIVEATNVMVLVSDKPSIFRIWKSLKPRWSKLIECECIVNDEGTVAYAMRIKSDEDKKSSLPQKLFSVTEIEELFKKNPTPFRWAPGFFGSETDAEQFKWIIEKAETGKVA